MATDNKSNEVVRQLLVVRLKCLEECIQQLKYGQHSFLQRSFMILRDYNKTGEASAHAGIKSDESGDRRQDRGYVL